MLHVDFFDAVPFDRDQTRLNFERLQSNDGIISLNDKELATVKMEEFLLLKMNEAISFRRHFVLETPLSHPDYWKYIDRFANQNYQVQLN